jgi:hypothetical protein
MLSSLALGSSGIFYLATAYFNIFDQKGLLKLLHIEDSLSSNSLAVISMRCYGMACFILAFILLHMIPHKDKHQAAIRTALMTTGCFAALFAHRVYLDPSVSATGAAASTQLMLFNSSLFVLSFVALKSLPPAVKDDNKAKAS